MTAPAPVAAGRKNWLKTALWVGAAVAACIVVGLAVWYLKPTPARPDSRAVRFFVSAPETWSLEAGGSALGGPVGPAAILVLPAGWPALSLLGRRPVGHAGWRVGLRVIARLGRTQVIDQFRFSKRRLQPGPSVVSTRDHAHGTAI